MSAYLDQDFQANSSAGIEVTPQLRDDWRLTSRWANFLSIIGFIFLGLSLLGIGTVSTVFATLADRGFDNPALQLFQAMGGWFTATMVLMLIAQFIITLAQFRFASKLREAIDRNDQAAFEYAWLQFRNFFRWSGIMVAAVLVLYFLAGIAAFIFMDLAANSVIEQ
ncbi:MAG: hypothetical protein JNK89_01915 [Saprospiraceae bacterium]|nr:hypothetical protein [Saprospiraceae bacterium]